MKKRTGYWLVITSRYYWRILQKKFFWAFSEKAFKRLDNIQADDKSIVYLTADGGRYISAIGGNFKFMGNPQRIAKSNSFFDNLFPNRVRIKIQKILDPPLPSKPFVGKVSFVGSGKNWGANLQGQHIIPIPEKDYNIIMKEIVR